MALLGKLFRRFRAGEHRSPLSNSGFDAPQSVEVKSAAFADGGPMPQSSAGKGVGTRIPALQGREEVKSTSRCPRPLFHTIAVIEPIVSGVAAGGLQPGTEGIRFVRADFGHRGYAGPRPIPDHGPHHYRFHVLAIDKPIPDSITTSKALLTAMANHVLARGVLTGTYER